MAHFAKLDDNNYVLEIHVVDNAVLDANDEEKSGIEFLTTWSKGYKNWKQTSYNGTIRYNYAGVGYFYDEENDAFIPPQPQCKHDELFLDKSVFLWKCTNELHKAPND